ncbi:hypothetical protein JTE90_024733 [Oedothorax gibbosus]|uniref:SAM domain-containing protein n=1 Tax=Oedothorax gibbosus TaxID=931172 RepID=A0AAV6UAC8_9ARAC|nr:hypothetical protein JTE90_024733 [Oedothorax gibbosus]
MADEETANLLRSWGLSQDVIDKFRENDIDCRALKELNEDDVSSFFSTLGQRLRFRSGLKSLHPVVQPVVLGIGPDTHDCILSDISLSSSDLGTTSCSSSANSLTYERVPLAQSTPSKQVTPSASSPLRNLGNGEKINARGKLYDQYHELRKLLIQSGQIESNKTKRQALNFDTDEEKDNEITNVKFEWLTKSSQPLNQAERYWEETRSKRLKQLDGENSITKYLETFPVLNENCGYTFFIESLKEFYIYLDTEGEHESTFSALRLLPLLLPVNKPIKTPNKTSYKPSKNDVADSMVIVVKSHADLKNAVAERKHHYAHLKLPFQPVTLTEDTDCISNFMQGDYWRNREKSKDVLTLPLFLFGDDYTCGNVLGSHGTIHKLGAMKEVKNDKMFAVLIDEFKFLAETGIHVNVPEFTGLVHFSLGLLIGDNLGLHEMAGFAGGFTANHPCRICTISRQEMFTKCDDKSLLLRNKENYNLAIEQASLYETGINEPCVWNSIPNFHATENLGVDIMHDMMEGTSKNCPSRSPTMDSDFKLVGGLVAEGTSPHGQPQASKFLRPQLQIGGWYVQGQVDTGAQNSFISLDLAQRLAQQGEQLNKVKQDVRVRLADGHLEIEGQITVAVDFFGHHCDFNFFVICR